jgi:hypothetical protein
VSDTIEFAITMENDEDGFFGRECPNDECLGYFKVELGTGLQGQDLPCHCPYCGHTDSHDHFWTQDQLEYAQSVGMRKAQDYMLGRLKDAFPPTRPRPGDFISISWKVKPGTPLPLHHYKEKKLETTVICDACGLRYAVYGVFAYCPDCGAHNSLQILVSNLDLASRELELAGTINQPLAGQLVSDALENAVAAFDAFARELFRVSAELSSSPPQAGNLSGQNLTGLKTRVEDLFGIDLSSPFDTHEWTDLVRAFQKRHLIAHKMGVIDNAYIASTGDPGAVKGRKVALSPEEVAAVLPLVRRLGEHAQAELKRLPPEGVGA